MELDQALFQIGDAGRYQNVVFALVAIPANFFAAWHNMATVFTAAWPSSYHCSLAEGHHKNQSIPVEEYDENGEPVFDSCHMYVNSSVDNTTTQCTDGWDYQAEFQETIVTQWDLVCDQTALSQISQSIYMIGVMIGALVVGRLSDRSGRKTMYLACLWSLGIFGTLTALTRTFAAYCILKFFIGLVQPGVIMIGFILATELYTPTTRVYAGFVSNVFWGVAYMLLAVYGYVFQHWRAFQVMISAPALLTLYYFWTVPESMRWLLSMGRTADVEKILQRAAKINGVDVKERLVSAEMTPNGHVIPLQESVEYECDKPQEFDQGSCDATPGLANQHLDVHRAKHVEDVDKETRTAVSEKEGQDPEYGCFDLMSTPRMTLYTTVMAFSWFVCSLVYYGLSYNTMNFQGSVYLLFFLAGCVEIPAYAICMVVVSRWGRRWPLFTFLVLSGVTCIALIFIPEGTQGGATFIGLKVIVMLLGKFSISAGYGTVYVWTPEIYPTLLRNFGFSFCEFCASIGGVVAPLTVIVAYNNIVIPFMIFGSLSLVAGFLVLLLPETKDKVMPRTIEEAENLAKSSLTVDHRANEGAVASARKYHDVVTQTEWDSDFELERANSGI